MFSTREKNDTSNQNREKCFFTCEKSDTSNQNSQRSVSCAPKFLPFIGACSFQRPRFVSSTSQTFNGKKNFLKSFSRKKVKKKTRKLEWNSFVYFSVDEENCREPAKQQRKRKNRRRLKLKSFSLLEPLCLLFSYIQIGHFA